MEVNAPETFCNKHVVGCVNSSHAREVPNICDTKTDCNIELQGNGSERKEESSEIDFVEQGLIDCQPKTPDYANGSGRNSIKTSSVSQTLSPKSILRKPNLSVSSRSKRMVKFAFMAMRKRGGNQIYSPSAEENLEPFNDRRTSTLLYGKFNDVSTSSRQDRVVASEENLSENTNLSVLSMSPLSPNVCAFQKDEVADSTSVGNLVSDELKSLVHIVRENGEESTNSPRHCDLSEVKDCENKDLPQNTSDSSSQLNSDSHLNAESKFGSPPKTYSYQLQLSPKSSFLISRGFPRIVLKDKSNKPQRVGKTVKPKKSWEGKEYHTKSVETSPNCKPKHSSSRNVELCSGESSSELKEDRKSTLIPPCVEDNRLLKILEVSLEKIDENVLIKYGVDLKDHNHTKLNKCLDKEDRTSLENVNDELKENTDVEVQKTKRIKSVSNFENISRVGKRVGIIKELKTPDDLGDSSSSAVEMCSDSVPKRIQTSKLNNKGEKSNDLIQESDTSFSIPMVNEENYNEASVSHTKPLSSSLLNTEVVKKCIRIHIDPLDPILLSKYGIDLEPQKTTNNNVQLMDNNSLKEGLTFHKTMTRANKKTSFYDSSENNIRSSKKSSVSSDQNETEVHNLDNSDQGMLKTITQEKKISKTSGDNLKKSRGSTCANTHDLKIVKTVLSKETASVNFRDVETTAKKMPYRNVKGSSQGFVNEHESSPKSPPRVRSSSGFNLEHQNTADSTVKLVLNKVNHDLTGHKMKNCVNNKESTLCVTTNNVGQSRECIISNDPSIKELVNSSEPGQDSLETVNLEQNNSDMTEKSRESIGPNLHDLDIINTAVSNKLLPDDTTNSGDVGATFNRIPPGNVKSSNQYLVSGQKSTLNPVLSSSFTDFRQEKISFSKEDPLLSTSVYNIKVAMVSLSRIDCDLSRYGIDKSELLASSCGKVNMTKETNSLKNEGTILANPKIQLSDTSTYKISSFKSKKRKRESVDTTAVVSTSSERHLRSIKRRKTE